MRFSVTHKLALPQARAFKPLNLAPGINIRAATGLTRRASHAVQLQQKFSEHAGERFGFLLAADDKRPPGTIGFFRDLLPLSTAVVLRPSERDQAPANYAQCFYENRSDVPLFAAVPQSLGARDAFLRFQLAPFRRFLGFHFSAEPEREILKSFGGQSFQSLGALFRKYFNGRVSEIANCDMAKIIPQDLAPENAARYFPFAAEANHENGFRLAWNHFTFSANTFLKKNTSKDITGALETNWQVARTALEFCRLPLFLPPLWGLMAHVDRMAKEHADLAETQTRLCALAKDVEGFFFARVLSGDAVETLSDKGSMLWPRMQEELTPWFGSKVMGNWSDELWRIDPKRLRVETKDSSTFQFRIWVSPESPADGVVGIDDNALLVHIQAVREGGNVHVLRVLSQRLGCAPEQIQIVSGEKKVKKTIEVKGMTRFEIFNKID